MSAPDDAPLGRPVASARQLLERFYYGHGPEVEQILRFAHDHKLDEDNLVFLLVSILKGNEELVRYILQAIDSTDRVIDNSKEAGRKLRALEQSLVAQIEEAANRSAGRLNMAADRLTATVAQVDRLCNGIEVATRELVRCGGVFNRAAELGNGERTLDRLISDIRKQALSDARFYYAEIGEEMYRKIERRLHMLHVYGIIGSIGVIGMLWTWMWT